MRSNRIIINLFLIMALLSTNLTKVNFAGRQEIWQSDAGIRNATRVNEKLGDGGASAVGSTQVAQWINTYGGTDTDAIDFVQETSDGGYIAIGKTHSFGASGEAAWVFKLFSDGTVAWEKRFSVTSRIFSVVENGSGFVFVGRTSIAGIGGADAWIVQLDTVGNIIWQQVYGGNGNDEIRSIQISGNGFIVAGETASFGAGSTDVWVLRLDNDGSILWQNTYGGSGTEYTGTNSALQETADGGVIVAGHTHSFGAGSSDFWVLKLTSSGAVAWQKAYGGPGEDQAESVRQTSDGGYIVAGHTASFGAGSWDAWVLKLDAGGTILWETAYGGSGTDTAFSIQETSDGGYVVAGNDGSFGAGTSNAWVFKLTTNGAIAWEHTFGGGGEEEAIHIEETGDSGFVVAARTLSFGAGAHDAWVLKLDTLGQLEGCPVMGISNAILTATNAQVTDTNVTPQSFFVTPVFTNDSALNTSIISDTTCSAGSCTPDLLAIYALAFDNDASNPANLTTQFQLIMDGLIAAATIESCKAAVVLADLDQEGDTIIYLVQNGVVTPIDGLPDANGELDVALQEYNMTDGHDLGDFLLWVQNTFTANKTMLSYIGHGTFLAPAVDPIWYLFPEFDPEEHPYTIEVDPGLTDVHPLGFMTPHALGEALRVGTQNGANPIDLLDLTHCFAASVEELYETANATGAVSYAEVVIGSPHYAYSSPDMPGRVLATIDPAADTATMAANVISMYDTILSEADSSDGDSGSVEHPRIMVAVDSRQLVPLKDEMDAMSSAIMQEFDNDSSGTKDNLLTAYLAAGSYYDTTFCTPEWDLAAPDALVDVGAFLQAVATAFGPTTEIGTHATMAYNLAISAVITRTARDGIPWFAGPLATNWTVTDANRLGLSLHADMQGQPDNSGDYIVVPWVPLYTDAPLVTIANSITITHQIINSHPYAFVQDGTTGVTWGDVLQRYWQVKLQAENKTLLTQPCLTRLPGARQEGELTAISITSPVPDSVTVGVDVFPSVVISTEQEALNPFVAFEVYREATLVYTNQVGAGYLLTGTHEIVASRAWKPTSSGTFTMSVTVDADNRFWEGNESDNTISMTDRVFDGPSQILTTTMPGDSQWLTDRQVTLMISSTLPADTLDIQVYAYAPGAYADTQLPALAYRHLDDAPLLDKNSYTFTLPDTVQPGPLTLHVWAKSNGRPVSQPSILHLNYAPSDRLLDTASDAYRLHPGNGAAMTMTLKLSVPAGEVHLSIWEPNNSWSARSLVVPAGISHSITISPTRGGDYLLLVTGQVSGTQYSISTAEPPPAQAALPLSSLTLQQRRRVQLFAPVPQAGEYHCLPVGVNAGSNLISVPFQTNDMRLATLFPDALTPYALQPGGLFTAILQTGQGYLVTFAADYVYPLCGDPVAAQTIPVHAGWNFVGMFDATVPVSALVTDPPGARQSPFRQLVNGSWIPVAELQPGTGYLVNFTQPATLLLATEGIWRANQ